MDKYLFTDGMNGIKEAQSKAELLALLRTTADPAKTRIWKFNSNEWLSYQDLVKKEPSLLKNEIYKSAAPILPQKGNGSWIRKTFFITVLLAGAMLIFNFTSAGWEKGESLKSIARRPANVPVMDIDSLVDEIEWMRGKLLDKSTRHNLRVRNNWPEYIQLYLDAEKETKGKLSRFFNVKISVDNSTGFELDHALVELKLWKEGSAVTADTIEFNTIRHEMPVRQLTNQYRGDSLSLSFLDLRAKAFNFCYSASIKNNPGSYNDRWFCRDGKSND